MSKIIYVSDIRDPSAIIAAFQEALDRVVTHAGMKKILTDRYVTYCYQYVHWNPNKEALGCVEMLSMPPWDAVTVFVSIKANPFRPEEIPLLPEGFIDRVYIEFEGRPPQVPFCYWLEHNTVGNEYRAMIQIPAEWSNTAPRLVIGLHP
jgi:hypothetical protein